jgi:type I restriction enzyme, S subunit
VSWPLVPVGQICEFKYGKSLSAAVRDGGELPVYGSNGVVGKHSQAITDGATIVIGRKGSIGELNYSSTSCWPIDTTYFVDKSCTEADLRWLFHALAGLRMPEMNKAAAIPGLNRNDAYAKLLRLPPLPEQRRIAAILDKADALRAKRREAIAKLDQLLQSVFLNMFGDPVTNPNGWPVVSLGDLAAWKSGGTPSRSNPAYFTGDIPWYASGELNGIFISDSAERITKQAVADSAAKLMEPGTLMIGMYDTSAFKLGIATEVGTCNQAIAFGLVNSVKADTLYVYHALDIGKEHFKRLQRGVRQKNLNLSMVRDTRVPCPPVELQKKFSSWFAMYWREVSKHRRVEERLIKLSSSLQATAFSRGL